MNLRSILFILFSLILINVATAHTRFQAGIVTYQYNDAFLVGDFNRDGKSDVITDGYDGGSDKSRFLRVFLSNGDGSFRASGDYPAPKAQVLLRSGDLDGDGNADVIAIQLDQGVATLYRGHGDGTFGAGTDISLGQGFSDVVVGDLNGDHRADFVVARGMMSGSTHATPIRPFVSLIFSQPDGSYSDPVDLAVGNNPRAIALGDLNGDGKPDIVVANQDSKMISVLMNQGGGLFASHVDYPISGGPLGIAAADFNGDGKPDLAVTIYGDSAINILLNRGDGTFAPETTDLANVYADDLNVFYRAGWTRPLFAGDLDGDGATDLLVPLGLFSDNNGYSVRILLGNGDGSFRSDGDLHDVAPFIGMGVGDFNGDSLTDFIDGGSSSVSKRYFAVLLNKRPGLHPPATILSDWITLQTSPSVMNVRIVEANGDKHLDILVWDLYKSEELSLYLGHGDGTFDAVKTISLQSPVNDMKIVDMNDDGKPDLVTIQPFYTTPFKDGFSVYRGNGDGTFEAPKSYAIDDAPMSFAIADFNGDGAPDLAVLNYTGDMVMDVSVFLNLGDGTFGTKKNYPVGDEPEALQAGDLNGDGKIDLLVTNGNYYHLPNPGIALYGVGDGTFGAPTNYPATSDFLCSGHIGDLNGDGQPDIVAEDDSYYSFSTIFWNRSPNNLMELNLPETFVGDFNDDGSPDLLGSAGVYGNFGDGTFDQQPYPLDFRSVEDIGDFNEDGKPDIVTTKLISSISAGVYVALNRSSDLSIDLETPVGKAGDRIGFTVAAPYALARTPAVSLSGSCIDSSSVDVTPLPYPNAYSGSFAIPSGSGDCSATITAKGKRKSDDADISGSSTFLIDRTPPMTTLTPNGKMTSDLYFYVVDAMLQTTDGGSGVLKTYYAIDSQNCSPQALDGCSIYKRLKYDPIYVNLQFYQDGVHTVIYFSEDVAGNLEPMHSAIFKVDASFPLAYPQTVTTQASTPIDIALSGYDFGIGDPLTYKIGLKPSHGTLSAVVENRVTYSPNTGYDGSDSFTFAANDGAYTSSSAMVTIHIERSNRPPTAQDQSVTVAENATKIVSLVGSDPDNDPLTFVIVKSPSHGTLSAICGNQVTYAPDASFIGSDGFTYNVSDGLLESDLAAIAIEVEPGACVAEKGDANGDGKVTIADATTALRIAVGLASPASDCAKDAIDANCDGKITIADATLILRNVVTGQTIAACSGT